METTETKIDGSIDSALESILAPAEETKEEVVEAAPEVIEEVTDEADDVSVEEVVDEETEETEAVETEETEADILLEQSDDDEDNTDQVEDAVHEELERFTVKVDGNDKQVTLDELKQGYSGQEYVQKGMQEAAEQKKQAEAVYTALLNERQQVAQLLEQFKTGNIAQEPTPPARELFETDPIGYMQEKLNYDEAKAGYDTQMFQMNEVANRQAESNQATQKEYLTQEMQKLKQAIPEFADANKANHIKEKLVRSGSEHYGYTAQEIGQVTDHRAIQVLNDAMKYREIMAGKAKAVSKTKKAKPVLKSGTKKVAEPNAKVRNRQQAKLRQSGTVEDALGLILNS